MEKPVLEKKKEEVTYFKLNNQINIPIDGKIPLHKDKEAAKAFFLEHVNPNTVFFHTLKEKIDYLIENKYIEKEFIDKYSFKFIKQLFNKAYKKKFRFKSFMGAHKFYSQYALKTNDGERYLERFEDRMSFVALYLANGDEELALNLIEELMEQRYVPATPTLLSSGRKRRGELVSCFLLSMTDDMNSIGRTVNSALQLSKMGGGVGINLTSLRASGDPIKGIDNAASGVVPVMKLLEDSFSYANQLGQRQGAGAVYLNVFHPDIVSFLSTKKENADEKIRVKTLSLGLVVPDKFYELAKNDEYMYLFSPYDVNQEYGIDYSYLDITKKYNELVDNPNIRKSKIKARELENEISKLQQESGYPYIINIDTVNRANNIDGQVIMSNLCSEIIQIQEPSKLNSDQTYEVMGSDISCNLGSTNIPKLMKSKDFGRSIKSMVRALTFVTDNTSIEEVPTVKNGNEKYHTIGLGAMGLHAFLAKNHIQYGSEEALEFTDTYFKLLNYWSLVESNNIAKERSETFYGFERSKYATGEYFNQYCEDDTAFKYDKIRILFKDIFIPRAEDWKQLAESVKEFGLYHAYRLAVAPNGSIGYVTETTSSLHPITQRVEERQEKKTGKTYYPAPYLSDKTIPYYQTAYETDMRKVIDTYAAAQKHIDQGMSLTLFMPSVISDGLYEWKMNNEFTTRDLNILRHYAFNKGIKSLYYVRTYTGSEEVGANECESCSI